MTDDTTSHRVLAVALTVLFGMLVGAAVVAAPAAADGNIPDDAPDLTEEANFTVQWPNEGDGQPGEMNPEGGSIEYFASGADAFDELGAEEGVWVDWVIIDAQWIDYSACETENTYVFGLDRGNNNSGTQIDDDLLAVMRSNNFRDDGLDVEFYDFDDFAGDPLRMMPEDAIVAGQGAGSAGGPCLTLTNEPGWYQIDGFLNGTVADNGDDEPTDDAETVSISLSTSNYLYVCDCEDRAEAEEELGPSPAQQENGEPTPEPETETPTPTEADSEETPADTPTPTEADSEETPADTPTPTEADSEETPADTPTPTEAADDAGGGGDQGVQGTPTPGDGAGFGAIAALLALLASALLVTRR